MKSSIILLAGCLCLTMVLGSCGSDDDGDYTCSQVCAKVGDCEEPADEAECNEMCAAIEPVMRDVSYNAFGKCLMDASCEELSAEACFAQAAAAAPNDATDAFVEALCEKIVECAGEGTVEACVAGVEVAMAAILVYLRIISDSALDCVATCYDDIECPVDQGDDVDDCMDECNIPMLFE